MSVSPRKVLAMAAAAAALVMGQVAVSSASAAPASPLQQKVDGFLNMHPDARQVGPNKVAIPGGQLTVATPGTTVSPMITCSSGHLCIQDGYGDSYDYYYCGYYDFWGVGDGVFNNNQTSGTVARFYNSNGSLRWTNTAKDTGTASWTPVYHIRPC